MKSRIGIFTYILIIFILVISFKMYIDSDSFNLKCIISTVDGNKYCVREREKLKDAADLLAKTTFKCKELVVYLIKKHPHHEITNRLKQGFDPKKIQETLPTSEHIAYSENKGEKIAFCLSKTKEDENKLIDENTLMFVALHELTHVATSSVGHTTDFWQNFKFIIENASQAKIYVPVDYKNKPTNYCGTTINDNPYYDLE